MPHHGKGPYLAKRRARRDANGKITHTAVWVIRDGTKYYSTRCGINDFEKARLVLEDYKTKLYAAKDVAGGRKESEVLIADLIRYYLECKANWLASMTPAKRREAVAQFTRLNEFWGKKTVDQINTLTSKRYQEGRTPNSVRAELVMLRAVINFGAAENRVQLTLSHNYALPPKPEPRALALSLQEVIALYKAARRRRHTFKGATTTHRVNEHIARFILVAVMTGTRANRICQASFEHEPNRPWVDLESGIFYRRAVGKMAPSNKRADPIRIPDRLLRLMKRWYRNDKLREVPGYQYLIHWEGRAVDCRKGYYTLKKAVFGKDRAKAVNRHTLKHTCVTWLLSEGTDIEDVATYVSTSPGVIRKVYRHLLAGRGAVNEVFSKRRVSARPKPSGHPHGPHLRLVSST